MNGTQYGSTISAAGSAATQAAPRGRSSYTGFNYGQAYGSNPFTGFAQRVRNQINTLGSPASGTGFSAGSSFSSTGRPRSSDPEVKDYMANVLGGQRNSLDDYVRRAAGAGIRRGGMNVAGGPALDSTLHQEATRTLASGYGDRFRDAMAHGREVRNAEYAQQAESTKNLMGLLDMEQRALAGEADWKTSLGDRMREDWNAGQQRDRRDPQQELALENMRRQMEQRRYRDMWERNDRQRATDQMVAREASWRAMLNRADLSFPGFSWKSSDTAMNDRLGVEMGYLQPWQRSVSYRWGGVA
jgi:hypothetical protein